MAAYPESHARTVPEFSTHVIALSEAPQDTLCHSADLLLVRLPGSQVAQVPPFIALQIVKRALPQAAGCCTNQPWTKSKAGCHCQLCKHFVFGFRLSQMVLGLAGPSLTLQSCFDFKLGAV